MTITEPSKSDDLPYHEKAREIVDTFIGIADVAVSETKWRILRRMFSSAIEEAVREAKPDRTIEREIGSKIEAEWRAAMAELTQHQDSTPRRQNKADAVRQAYLMGRVKGLGWSHHEFQLRQPLHLVASSRKETFDA